MQALSKDVSVIAPVFNEVDAIDAFYSRTSLVLQKLGLSYELIFVNDGSTDGSQMILNALVRKDSAVQAISFTRNFGHQAALTAGFHAARGRVVVVIDTDLQDPPELIPEMLDQWQQGSMIVDAVRTERQGETVLKKKLAHWFYRLFNKISDIDITLDAGDFRLYDRTVVDVINALPERVRFYRGLAAWTGFSRTKVFFEREARKGGKTKYPLRKQLSFGIEAVTSFSSFPLRAVSLVGFATCMVTIVAIPVVLILRLIGFTGLGGQTTLLMASLLFFGLLSLFVGVVGHYVARINSEALSRPLYVMLPHRPEDDR
jgi:polyisoprenyl-phosphate glycosyltransferase